MTAKLCIADFGDNKNAAAAPVRNLELMEAIYTTAASGRWVQLYSIPSPLRPQQRLNLLPLPQGQGWLRPGFHGETEGGSCSP